MAVCGSQARGHSPRVTKDTVNSLSRFIVEFLKEFSFR